jgi:two-component system cell cycle sensor histidine kinase/response regulator CckA
VSGVHASLVEPASDEDRDALANVEQAVRRGAALTQRLLVFGRKDAPAVAAVDVRTHVRGLVDVLRRTLPEDVALSLAGLDGGAALGARVDPVRLEQMVLNLVVNARDALGGAGRIALEVDALVIGEGGVLPHDRAAGEYVAVRVHDPGSGIEPAVLERIFEPFFTTKAVGRGSGLGLAIVHAAVREAGGFVAVDSTVGRGSTFTLYLPRVEPIDGDAAPPPTPVAVRARGVVLLCDDEPGVAAAAARGLRRAGLVVHVAEGPDLALRLAEEHRDALGVLVSDVVMPAMNGPELARRVRALVDRELPVLFVSGHTRDVVLDRGVLGEADVLGKPFTIDALVDRVVSALGRSDEAARSA